jgi:hypothetical protein
MMRDEIEITSEMAEAGAEALASRSDPPFDIGQFPDGHINVEFFTCPSHFICSSKRGSSLSAADIGESFGLRSPCRPPVLAGFRAGFSDVRQRLQMFRRGARCVLPNESVNPIH